MLRRLILHPLLFTVYPVVFLYAQNLDDLILFETIVVVLLTMFAGTVGVFLLLRLLLRNTQKAALVTSLYVILFYSYGHVSNAFMGRDNLLGEILLLLTWELLAAYGTIFIKRAELDLGTPTMVLNVLAASLVVINVVPISIHELWSGSETEITAPEIGGLPGEGEVPAAEQRDIYYIIFDRYANEKTLSRLFDFNNDGMLRFFESKGFYVAHDSAANYVRTQHSLASSLNLSYLDFLTKRIGPVSGDFTHVFRLLRGFRAARYLQSIGYRYHHIGSYWEPTRVDPSADVEHQYPLSEFTNTLIRSTLLWELGARFYLGELFEGPRADSLRVLAQFEKLAFVEEDPAPTFTFAHFLLPHQPYIFDRNGNVLDQPIYDGFVSEDDSLSEQAAREAYLEQLIYTNKLIRELVTKLLDGPDARDPIVIIQSDEGPNPREYLRVGRFSYDWFEATDSDLREKLLILNAYYLPGSHDDGLYNTISPVNSFRLLFREYFGADLPLLDDRSFVYQDDTHLYKFKEVTDQLGRRDS